MSYNGFEDFENEILNVKLQMLNFAINQNSKKRYFR